jgi:antitoxin (DNA-binding transcriptional repressor) of toxin-antitoxin stability system
MKPTRAQHLAHLDTAGEVSVEGLRILTADVLNRAARGLSTYVTSRRRRVAVIHPIRADK